MRREKESRKERNVNVSEVYAWTNSHGRTDRQTYIKYFCLTALNFYHFFL